MAQIKYEYGNLAEKSLVSQRDNTEYASYFWKKDNESIANGRLIIKRYSGKPSLGNSIEDVLQHGAMQFTAYFKGEVGPYDEESDEHFVLFPPTDYYTLPKVSEKAPVFWAMWGCQIRC